MNMEKTSPEASAEFRAASPAMLFVTAGITGALVMVIEILGARIIGPFFGVSLFVWTALISVTLAALAGGYAFGGWLADRRPDADRMYLIIAAAGLWLILLPFFRTLVLEAAVPAGLRAGAFMAALVLFGPALFLLGCVSPFLLRISAAEWARLGRTAGLLYAVSTAGSFIGAAGTGFYLLGNLGVMTALRLTGGILVGLAAIYFFMGRRRSTGALMLAGLLPITVSGDGSLETALADGTRVRILWSRDSYYGAVRVLEYRGTNLTTREMTIDGLVQGGMDVADGRSVYEYPYLLERLPLAAHPDGKSALMVGLGTGIVPRRLEERGIDTEVVEIDPLVAQAARRHFGFPERIPVIIEDARTFLGRPGKRYDYLLIDVFNGDTTPGYLLSREALKATRERLAPGGVLAFNLIAGSDPATGMLPSVLATLRQVFREVSVHPADMAADSGNFVILASDQSLQRPRAPELDGIHPLAAAAASLLSAPARFIDTAGALVLTDDFNPLDQRDARYKEQVRRTLLETTPHSILHAMPGNTG